MSGIFEQLLAEQQKTNSLLEQLLANGGASSAAAGEDAGAGKTTAKGKTTTKGKTTAAADKPKHTKDEVVAAVVAVKDRFGAPEAKKITAKFGLAKIAEAKEEHFDAIFDLCEAKLAEQEEDEGNSEEDDV
ncbi:hypothetical protein CPT_Seifer_004 [Klebsiella phage Seifer]|uniref:RecT protein n=1 Tax=Klebsiella phage Seifer TaxID=2315475 RepID=A0A3B8DHT9_9CAUD|nr:hypothetical protein HWB88_gp04 [Klebsiella phage Seifer]AYJ72786.1 hypothetical protein CPT_Seifer_004 [Klebsiella phage Seifer]